MSSNKANVTIKHQDGSILVVQVANISDPKLKEEVERILKNTKLSVNGPIIKKV